MWPVLARVDNSTWMLASLARMLRGEHVSIHCETYPAASVNAFLSVFLTPSWVVSPEPGTL